MFDKYVQLYSGAEPVFEEGDVFKLTVPLDDNFSPEVRKKPEKRGTTEKTTGKTTGKTTEKFFG